MGLDKQLKKPSSSKATSVVYGFKLFAAIDQVLMAVFFWEDIYEQL
jgi:hypothetical protein